jgi:uncharacterized protein (DUF952 family)/uncharacterized glyoxalase superfamily protein PhnB
MEILFHIARRRDWEAAQHVGAYRISTLDRTLEQEGFIHLSFARQVRGVADRFYAGVDDQLVLLSIDPTKLTAPVVTEPAAGTNEEFPHLYGELPVAAVRRVTAYTRSDNGRFGPPPLDNRTMPAAVVIPQLSYDDVSDAIEWLCGAFGFSVRWQAGDHRAQLEVPGGGCVVVTEGRSSSVLTGLNSVLVRVGDVDAHHSRAHARGATILDPPRDHPYGERQYTAEDLAGHHWAFTQSVADVAPEDWGGRSGPALSARRDLATGR